VRADIHQHLWPEDFIAALARRKLAPALRRSGNFWILRMENEPDLEVDLADNDPDERVRRLEQDGVDFALICSSSPLGIEALPAEEAFDLLETYHEGILELPGCFGAWGAVPVSEPDPDQIDRLIERGFVGVSLPAAALATASGLERCGPLLERLEQRDAALFVHPGPAPWRRHENGSVLQANWWTAMTDYLFDLHAAWHAFISVGRKRHPYLRVLFAALAGGGPLHTERLASRNGAVAQATDDRIFFDTSSYGTKAIDATTRSVGVEQLVYGSDRPVVEPRSIKRGDAALDLMRSDNVQRLLGYEVVAA
jgi:predicted TIM-barrel fold metal-dependent hydrolase